MKGRDMTSLDVNGVSFNAHDDLFSEMVCELAVDIFDAIGVDPEYDEELDVETEGIFDDFRYDTLEGAVLEAVQEAIDKVKLDFTDEYRDMILQAVHEKA